MRKQDLYPSELEVDSALIRSDLDTAIHCKEGDGIGELLWQAGAYRGNEI